MKDGQIVLQAAYKMCHVGRANNLYKMKETNCGYTKEGYCEESARTTSRVIDYRTCSNKARYRVTFNGRSINVCGAHLRQFYKVDWDDKPIKGKFLDGVEKVVDLKTGKTIYEKTWRTSQI